MTIPLPPWAPSCKLFPPPPPPPVLAYPAPGYKNGAREPPSPGTFSMAPLPPPPKPPLYDT